MEITLKNNRLNERSNRPFFDYDIIGLNKELRKFKRRLKKLTGRKVETIIEIVAVEKEIELRKHKDFEQYNQDWLRNFQENVMPKFINRLNEKINYKIAEIKKLNLELDELKKEEKGLNYFLLFQPKTV